MDEKKLEYRLEQDVRHFSPQLMRYQHTRGMIDIYLCKIERKKRSLIHEITLMRAISHSTDGDKSPEDEEYRAYVFKKAYEAYVELRVLEQEEREFIEEMHKVNHDFVEEIIAKNKAKNKV